MCANCCAPPPLFWLLNGLLRTYLHIFQICCSSNWCFTAITCDKSFWNSTCNARCQLLSLTISSTWKHACRKYNPKTDGQKVPFFSGEEIPRPPNADVLFSPRDNPRAVIVGAKYNADKSSLLKNTTNLVNGFGNTDQCSLGHGQASFVDLNVKHNGVHDDEYTSIELTSRESSDGPVMHDSGTDVVSLMPKLLDSEYYSEPSIQDLAVKERAEPGFCCHVKDFVVGHYSYGCIKFPGETDVQKIDLESIIRFNNREVIVYMDESKRPPVGQGLNKPAEVTLLNIKCLDKIIGKQCMDKAKVDTKHC